MDEIQSTATVDAEKLESDSLGLIMHILYDTAAKVQGGRALLDVLENDSDELGSAIRLFREANSEIIRAINALDELSLSTTA